MREPAQQSTSFRPIEEPLLWDAAEPIRGGKETATYFGGVSPDYGPLHLLFD